jgi:hypothetical protein
VADTPIDLKYGAATHLTEDTTRVGVGVNVRRVLIGTAAFSLAVVGLSAGATAEADGDGALVTAAPSLITISASGVGTTTVTGDDLIASTAIVYHGANPTTPFYVPGDDYVVGWCAFTPAGQSHCTVPPDQQPATLSASGSISIVAQEGPSSEPATCGSDSYQRAIRSASSRRHRTARPPYRSPTKCDPVTSLLPSSRPQRPCRTRGQ